MKDRRPGKVGYRGWRLWLVLAGSALASDIVSIDQGYLTLETPDTNLYYTVEARPNWGATSTWDGAYRGLQDIRSTQSSVTVPVGVFYRVVGSPTPLHTRSLSPSTTVVAEGFYAATNLMLVAPNLHPDNIRFAVEIFGVTGTVLQATGDAVSEDILQGKSAWVDGQEVLGTMPNIGSQYIIPAVMDQVISRGYHDGTGKTAGDEDLLASNIKAGVTIFGVTGSVIEATGAAAADQVLNGATFSIAAEAGLTGTMPNRGGLGFMPDVVNVSIPAGYYDGSGVVTGDASLVSGNIRSSATIFGVSGDPAVVDTSSGTAVTGDVLIGKTVWVNGSEITGSAYPAPVAKTSASSSDMGVTWPSPRFTIGSDTNVVIDNLTGLIWARNASLGGTNTWDGAVTFCDELTHGGYSDWRLPSRFELDSLIDLGQFDPALPLGHLFANAQLGYYWSSTPRAGGTASAWYVNLRTGDGFFYPKSSTYYVWPVRNGS